jgi:hypothetical protein
MVLIVHKDVRYVDIHQNDQVGDELQSWIRQASKLPGWVT